MNVIAAVNENWGIGKNNDLLYHLPSDMKFFREKTKGNIIIVGRRTLESFPNAAPLKDRINIVLTKDKSYKKENAIICGGISQLFDILKKYDSKSIYVCGGEMIYSLLLPYCDTAYITKVFDSAPSEKFFPDLDKNPDWKLDFQSEQMVENGLSFAFCTYKKH